MSQPPQNPPKTALKSRVRQFLPFVGAVLLIGYFLRSTDLAKVHDALQHANFIAFIGVILAVSLVVWLYDSYCLVWLIGVTLGHRGTQQNITLKQVLPLKAASYVLNMLNYHAAALGMAVLVGRRKQVPFLEAAGALAVLSYLDLVSVASMCVAGLLLAPDVLGGNQSLQQTVQILVTGIFCVALLCLALLQSKWNWPFLVRLRGISVLRPLASLRPSAMIVGVLLRMGLMLMYTVAAVAVMRTFGMQPEWRRMLVAMPILTVIGTLPLSVSGVGTTQVPMRWLYAPFVVDGRAPSPVIDAYSLAFIFAYIVVRLFIAAPFLRAINAELRAAPATAEASLQASNP